MLGYHKVRNGRSPTTGVNGRLDKVSELPVLYLYFVQPYYYLYVLCTLYELS